MYILSDEQIVCIWNSCWRYFHCFIMSYVYL